MQPVEDTLKNLKNEAEPISVAGLFALSGLDRADLTPVRSAWGTLSADRRQAAMRHLVDIAEDNFEVDFGAIFRLGLNDQDPDVRAAALEGLWEDDDAALIAPILKLLTDPIESVRVAAAGALGRFVYAGELEDIPASKVAPVTKALKAAYASPTEALDVRRRALEALGFLGYAEVGDLIRQGYQHAELPMRLSAVFAMGRSADDEHWGETVVSELNSPAPEMRFEAARACGELEYTPAVRRLAELLDDVDENVQQAAVWSLGQIGGDKARQLLQAVLLSDAEHLHEDAEAALDELEFKGNNLDFTLIDFEDDDEDEWVLDQEIDDDDEDA
ncbi:MAG: HEAT repeat domain-containing protein [Chloroflexi bacterium]|nr:HEAT repeat domain-containing protein [Chloroflexota bacterium]